MSNSGVRVEPVNFYMSDDGSANFTSNVMDNRKFFRMNSHESVERDLQMGNGITNKNQREPFRNQEASNNRTVPGNISLAIPNYHNPPTEWSYNNELVMNGAKFGDIYGFNSYDDTMSQYESFSIAKPNSDVLKYNYDQLGPKNRISDDLRMGLGKTAAPIRATN
jgi:hypothetical protein